MKIKTQDLTGAALDWAVAKCEGREATFGHGFAAKFAYYPSKRWAQGGPIIEKYRVTVRPSQHYVSGWEACTGVSFVFTGKTPLIAAMRCIVASNLGDEVEIPEELCHSS